MTKRGTWRLPFLPNWHIVSKAHQQNARFFKRLAPQKWCVQFWCSSKPGGVMFPPELLELTPCLYSSKPFEARENLANLAMVRRLPAEATKDVSLLFYEQSLAKLVTADKRFHGSIAAEEILNFPVLINALRRADDRGRNHLQSIRIHHAIALKTFGFLVVEHCKHHAAGTQQFRQRRNDLLHQSRLEIIQKIPEKHGIERTARVLQIPLQEAGGSRAGSHLEGFAGSEVFSQTSLFFG